MLKIGLTGNLCSGYIEVAKILENFDVPVFDADIALKFLLNYREDIIRNIKIQFGDVFNAGLLDVKKFNTNEKFSKLIDIAKPELMKIYESFRFTNKHASYTVFKSSILFEKGMEKEMNDVICCFSPREKRAIQYSNEMNITLADAYTVLENEMDELVKNQKATWVIHNYDNLSLLVQSKETHDKIEGKSIRKILDNIQRDSYNTAKNIIF